MVLLQAAMVLLLVRRDITTMARQWDELGASATPGEGSCSSAAAQGGRGGEAGLNCIE